MRRCALDHAPHGRSSLRKTAEPLRSILGHQERWLLWRPLDLAPAEEARCRRTARTIERWLEAAGKQAHEAIRGQRVSHQRGVFHLWKDLRPDLLAAVTAATANVPAALAQAARREVRRDLVGLIRQVYDASTRLAAPRAIEHLAAHPCGTALAARIDAPLEAALGHLLDYHPGLDRTSPAWLGRDFRICLSHGRNHFSARRWERAALVFAIDHKVEPAQERRELHRPYRPRTSPPSPRPELRPTESATSMP